MVTKLSKPASVCPGPGFGSRTGWSIITQAPPSQKKSLKSTSGKVALILVAKELPRPQISSQDAELEQSRRTALI